MGLVFKMPPPLGRVHEPAGVVDAGVCDGSIMKGAAGALPRCSKARMRCSNAAWESCFALCEAVHAIHNAPRARMMDAIEIHVDHWETAVAFRARR